MAMGMHMTNTGTTIPVMDTGSIILMATTVFIMSGGIPGGGIGTGGGATGVIISVGISSTVDSMWSGMRMVAGGGVPDMAAG